MLLVRHFQGAQHPWYAYRAPADLRCPERHRGAVRLQKQRWRHCGRRGLAAVECLYPFAVPVQDERPTANAAGLRLDQGEYHLHGNCRIDGAAAGAQHRTPGFTGQRVGSRHHVPVGVNRLQAGAVT
ncbi:hypothetical protein D3C81_984560 [compost metagenome]